MSVKEHRIERNCPTCKYCWDTATHTDM